MNVALIGGSPELMAEFNHVGAPLGWNILADSTSTKHYPLVKQVLENGRHVLCEPPLAFTPAECLELGQLADSKHLTLLVNYRPWFLDSVKAVPRGHWKAAKRMLLYRTAERAGHSSPLWDLAIHDLALLDHLIGKLPEQWHLFTAGNYTILETPRIQISCGYGSSERRAYVQWMDNRREGLPQEQGETQQSVLAHFRQCVEEGVRTTANAELSARIATVIRSVGG